MPHLRPRHLQGLLKRSMKFSPITGLFGHRQVGKTTLASAAAGRYLSLDDRATLDLSLTDPDSFLRDHEAFPLVLDECQLSPPLFPALKERVRKGAPPGSYLLTGSVRFSSRKA